VFLVTLVKSITPNYKYPYVSCLPLIVINFCFATVSMLYFTLLEVLVTLVKLLSLVIKLLIPLSKLFIAYFYQASSFLYPPPSRPIHNKDYMCVFISNTSWFNFLAFVKVTLE
jgi:hypothetical protein